MTLLGRPVAHWLLLILLVAMWGTSFVFTKIAVDNLPPATVVGVRLLIGALVLLVGLVILGERLPRDRPTWSAFVTMAVVGNAIPFFLIGWGQQEIDSGLAGILMAAMPLMTLVLAHIYLDDERLTVLRVLGFAVGFIGIVVLLGPDIGRRWHNEGGDTLSKIAVLAGAFCYAVNTILARRRPTSTSYVAATGVVVTSSVIMIPVAAAMDGVAVLAISQPAALSLAFLGVVSTAMATVVYFRLITVAGPTFLSLINYLIPIWAVAAGWFALSERPSAWSLVALVLVLSGIALSQRR